MFQFRRCAAAAGAFTLLLGAVAGTGACVTAAHRTHNVITAGSICIALKDQMDTGSGIIDWPVEQGVSGALPGQVVSKIVSVQNTCGNAAWVRVRAVPCVTLPSGKPSPECLAQIGYVHCAGGTQQPGYNTAAWEYDPATDYYYCLQAIAPGATTPPLFDGVQLKDSMDSTCAQAKITVKVSAQAVQTANNGASWQQVTGWPAG